ncbi:hypothetical protein TNCV_3360841 [Trichonephila clavipes]|nr:hypothetical protein TNCV_3360841 [Trichonephila clavipes]
MGSKFRYCLHHLTFLTFSRHTSEKSTSFCGQDNSVPMYTYTPKYCGVLSSVIAPATLDRKKNSKCNARCQKETDLIQRP